MAEPRVPGALAWLVVLLCSPIITPLQPLPSHCHLVAERGRRSACLRCSQRGAPSSSECFPHLGLQIFSSAFQVGHIFSHIHQTYVVYSLLLGGDPEMASDGRDEELERPAFRWVTQAEFQKSAVSTAMKKVLDHTPWDPWKCGEGLSPMHPPQDSWE